MTTNTFAKTATTGLLALLLSSASTAAFAQTDTEARIKALEAQLNILAAQITDLKEASAADASDIRTIVNTTQVAIPAGRPTFTSGDGQFTAAIRGVMQYDVTSYQQDPAGPLATDFRRAGVGAADNGLARDLSDGSNFRRARIGIEGKAFGDWEYNFLYDFGGSGTENSGQISSAWLQYNGLGRWKARIGAFSPNSGLEESGSTNGSLFAERGAASEVVRGLNAGDGRAAFSVFGNGERWFASAAVTGNLVNTAITTDEQLGATGRVAYVPLKRENSLVHIGANVSTTLSPVAAGFGPGVATNVRLRERPEARVDGTRLVDTGNIDADNLIATGLEFAAQHRNFLLQAEYFNIDVERRVAVTGIDDPSFDGWYVQGGWTLTGEPRRYAIASASFDGPRPNKNFSLKDGGIGAWELAARYSTLDLNHNAGLAGTPLPLGGIRGGQQDIVTVGLNWYPNQTVRFMASYQAVSIDRLSLGGTFFGSAAGETPAAGAQVGQDFDIWSLRTQYAF